MMAAAEKTKREGKSTSDTQAVGILPNDIAGFTGFIHSISVISFSLSLLLGSALILTSPSANAQGIVADKSAPAQQQPTTMQTGNSITQANIQPPTAAGVSVNQYTHFAVNTNSANSLYTIDTEALGSMYAGKITLISTERDISVRNQGQWFTSAGNVAVNAEGKLVNTGTIAATGKNHTVSLHARNVRNSGTIASQDAVDRGLPVDSRNIDNRNGSLLSVNNTQQTVSDDLDNGHGKIATNRQLSIHDKNQNTLALNNADGTIQSAGNISLQAKSLANNGTLTAGNKLDITLADDFVVERDLTAGNQLNLSTKGRLKNTHTLQAGHTLKLNAGNIDNQVTGKIIAEEQTSITSEQHGDNRGLINSNGLTHIGTGQTLTNTGTDKIYGNHIALGAQKLLNREETAEGGTKAGTIAARKRLDIEAKEIHNQEGALLSSEGIMG